jgi:hypothetical protein
MSIADDPGIEVRNGHRRRTDIGHAVDFGVMPFVDGWVVAAQPNAADREAGVTVRFRNPRFLQERQGAAAGAEKDEFCRGRCLRLVGRIDRFDAPAAPVLAVQSGDAARIVNGEAAERLQITDEIAGQRPVIHVRAGDHPGSGDDVGVRS